MRSRRSGRRRRSAPSSKWRRLTHGVDLYARRVLGDRRAGGRLVAGPLVRKACERHLADRLKRGFAYRFDADKADAILEFFETVLRLPDVLDADGQPAPFRLEPWQVFIVGSLFGWVTADGTRRFREAYIEVGKGNGKTPLAAGIGLFGLTLDHEHAAEVYAAAADQLQAQILFRDAVRIVEASPDLRQELHLSGGAHVWNIAHEESLSFFRTFSRESGAKSGPRPHMGLLDEVHEHGTPQIVIKVRAGAKGRRQPLFVEITNSGFDRTSICWQHHEHSRRVVEGVVRDDRWFAYVCALDEGDDPLVDDTCWPKANPNLGVSIRREYLKRQVESARHIPSETNTVLRLNFCVWTQGSVRFFDMTKWRACPATVPEAELEGRPCYGGLDLGQSDDLSAWARVWDLEDGRIAVKLRVWIPEASREKYPDRPYEEWIRAGLLEWTEGNITDYDRIEEAVLEDARASGCQEIAYDKRFAQQLALHLQGAGLTMVDTPQGFALNEAIKRVAEWVVSLTLCHGGHAILTWAADNTVVRHGRNKEVRLDKEKSKEKIDPISALVMAAARLIAQEPPGESVYESRGLTVLGGRDS